MVSGLGMSENVGENDASNNDYLMGFSGLNGHVEKNVAVKRWAKMKPSNTDSNGIQWSQWSTNIGHFGATESQTFHANYIPFEPQWTKFW